MKRSRVHPGRFRLKITDVNEATVRLTCVPRDTLIGTSFSGYFTNPKKADEVVRGGIAELGRAVLVMCHGLYPQRIDPHMVSRRRWD